MAVYFLDTVKLGVILDTHMQQSHFMLQRLWEAQGLKKHDTPPEYEGSSLTLKILFSQNNPNSGLLFCFGNGAFNI